MRRVLRGCLTLVLLVSAPAMVVGQGSAASPRQPPQDPRAAQAYYHFLMGRQLEREGDIEKAIEAFRTAARLDPDAAEILTDLAGLFARQGRASESIEAARSALRIDDSHRQAHRVLGLVLAALAEETGQDDARFSQKGRQYAEEALTHLERALPDVPGESRLRVTLARLHLGLGASEKVIDSLRALLEEEPDNREAVLLIARAYSEAGRRDEAIATLEQFVNDEPRSYRALMTLAELYEAERRWADAARAYEKAAGLNIRNGEVRRRWAAALVAAGESARAVELLRDITSASPNDTGSLYLLAEAARHAGNLTAAERAARRLLELDGDNLRAVDALARILEDRGEYGQLADMLAAAAERARQHSPDQRAALLVELGRARETLGDRPGALRAWEEADKVAPDDPRIAALLVQSLLEADHVDRAIETIERARAHVPGDVRLARLHADALVQAGRSAEALTLLERAVRDSADPPGYAALADLYATVERFDDAFALLEEARSKFPNDTTVLFQLGALFDKRRRYADAERVFRDLIARDPSHAPALNYLGYLLAERGERLEESVELISRALALDPGNGAYLDSLGWAYFKLNRFDLAEGHLRRAAGALRRNSVIQDHYGDLLVRLGRHQEAIDAWQRALAGDRDSIEPAELERKIGEARRKTQQP